MANSKLYISMPTPQTPQGAKAGIRRSPLSPQTLTPPAVNPQTIATRAECGKQGRPGATAILARVASSPIVPRRTSQASPSSSPPSPTSQFPGVQSVPRSPKEEFRELAWNYERKRKNSQEPEGYISFPDFEKFEQNYETNENQDDREAVKSQ